MSTEENVRLLERAAEMIDYWQDKQIAQVIEADLDRSDMEALYGHVCRAEAMAAEEEFESSDVY